MKQKNNNNLFRFFNHNRMDRSKQTNKNYQIEIFLKLDFFFLTEKMAPSTVKNSMFFHCRIKKKFTPIHIC